MDSVARVRRLTHDLIAFHGDFAREPEDVRELGLHRYLAERITEAECSRARISGTMPSWMMESDSHRRS